MQGIKKIEAEREARRQKAQNDKLVMLGETQEYEPLSRAAYFKAVKHKQEIESLKNTESEVLKQIQDTKDSESSAK